MNRLDSDTHGVVHKAFCNMLVLLDLYLDTTDMRKRLTRDKLIRGLVESVRQLPPEVRATYLTGLSDLSGYCEVLDKAERASNLVAGPSLTNDEF